MSNSYYLLVSLLKWMKTRRCLNHQLFRQYLIMYLVRLANLGRFVNTKFPNCRKSKNWKEMWFANINLYWWIMSTIFISILLQKNTLWFYLLWTWLEQEIFLTLVGRWIEWSSQQMASFELIRDLLFFKSSNVKALRFKFFEVLEAWFVELQRFGFVEVYEGFLDLIPIELQRIQTRDLLDFGWKMDWTVFSTNL